MMAGAGASQEATVLLVYYSPEAHQRLEAVLSGMDVRAYPVNGRSPDAIESLRSHPAKVVVIDRGVQDVSVTQAVRRLGQVLPSSVVIAAVPDSLSVELYKGGRRMGLEASLEAALMKYVHGAAAA